MRVAHVTLFLNGVNMFSPMLCFVCVLFSHIFLATQGRMHSNGSVILFLGGGELVYFQINLTTLQGSYQIILVVWFGSRIKLVRPTQHLRQK